MPRSIDSFSSEHEFFLKNLSFSIFAHPAMDASSTITLWRHLMRTGTESISVISAATIYTSLNFHIFRLSSFRFSGEGEVDVYRMCMCFIVSIPCHGIRSSRHQGVSPVTNSPPRNHLATNQHATKKPSRHQPTRRQVK